MIAHPRAAVARPTGRVGVALGARAALAGLVAVSAAVRFLVALRHLAPSWFPDEYLYASLSRSLGESGRPLVRGAGAHFPAILEPLLAAPLWAVGSVETGYRLVQLENAVLMSLAAVPVYLLARRLAFGTRYSLACAAFAVATPSLAYSGSVLADPVAYPLALAALAAGVAALDRPARGPQVAFLALASLACFARVQYVVLFPAFAVAALVVDRRRAFRTQRLPLGLFAAAAALVAAVGLERTAGYYSNIASDHLGGSVLRWLGSDLFLLALASGVAIVPGAVLGFLFARDRVHIAFAALAGLFTLAVLFEGALYAANGADAFKGRYLMSVGPLLPLAFGIYLRRRRPAAPLAGALAAAVAVTAAVVPVSGYAAGGGYGDSPFLWCLTALQWRLGIADASLVFALAGTAGAGLAAAVAWRRVSGRAVIAWTFAIAVALSTGASIFSACSSKPVRAQAVAPDPSWVDAAHLGPVAAVQTPGGSRGSLTQQLFWNRQLDRELLLDGADATDAFATSKLTVRRDGALLAGGRPLATSLLFQEFLTTPVLSGVEPAGRFSTFALLRRTGTPRLRLLEVGRFWDGWLALRGTLQAWPSRPGTVTFTLSLPRSSPHAVVIRIARTTYRVAPGARVPVSIPLLHAGPWSASFAAVSGASALPDGRPVTVRASVPVLATR